jgi:hypothetical protein
MRGLYLSLAVIGFIRREGGLPLFLYMRERRSATGT